MRILFRFLLASLALAAPAAAERPGGNISLAPGEAVTLLFDDGELPHETARGPAPPLNDFQREAIRAYRGGAFDHALGPVSAPFQGEDIGASPPPIARGEIRITFIGLDGGARSLLMIENGYGRALSYRAVMHGEGRSAPTDVCQVLPDLRSFEWWPHPIARLELSQLRLVRWIPGRPPLCE